MTENGYESIGFIMENKAGHKPLSTYALTVDEVETRTESTFGLSVWNLK